MSLLPLLLLACTFGPSTPFEGDKRAPSQRFEDPGLSTGEDAHAVRLWLAEGTYDLPDRTLPDGFDPEAVLPVDFGDAPATTRKQSRVWKAPSPFRDHVEGRRSAPAGMKLQLDGKDLTYDRRLGRPKGRTGAPGSWTLTNDGIEVAWFDEARPLGPGRFPGLRYGGAATTLLRRDPARSDLDVDSFVAFEVTHEGETRPGLLLPAPGSARFELTLPAGRPSTFDAHLTMAPTPLRKLGSDGAWAVVEVVAGGETTQLSRTWVDGDASGFEALRHDLGPWAGQQVELILRTEPHEHNHFDHVVFGAPTVWTPQEEPPRRIVVIGMDTTRPQEFGFYGYGRDTTPELDAIAEHATVFTRAWTPAPRTRPSFRSATTGRNPLDAVGATNIAEVFSDHGFATAGFVANIHLQPRFDFHQGFDRWWFDGKAQAEDQVDRTLAFLQDNRDRDTYVFVHIMDPHMAYGAPGSYDDMFVEDPDPDLPNWFSRSDVYKWMRSGKLDERRKEHIRALYDGELRYTSTQLARLFDQLDRLEGRTLVVVHNDHGEEFWEHGGFEHNHTLYDDVTRGLLWFRAGGGQQEGATIEAPVSLPDIGTTLYDFAGFDDAPQTDGRSLKGLLTGTEDAADWADRPIGIAHLRYGFDRWGVSWRNHKYILHTNSGAEELYDLTADPGEQQDLSTSTDLDPWREKLGEAHGIDAGPGWRFRVIRTAPDDELTVELPTEAAWAVVVPPSMTIEHPANQAWGEPPRKPITEIGSVALSDDKRTLTYTAGTRPVDGLIFVRFAEPTSPDDARLLAGDEELALTRTTVWSHGGGGRIVRIEPGTVFKPPPSEADRMKALAGEVDEENIEQLCELGYVTGPRCQGVEGAEVGDDHDHGEGTVDDGVPIDEGSP